MTVVDFNQILNSEGLIGAMIAIAIPILGKVLHQYGIAVAVVERLAKLWSITPCSKDSEVTPTVQPVAPVNDFFTRTNKSLSELMERMEKLERKE